MALAVLAALLTGCQTASQRHRGDAQSIEDELKRLYQYRAEILLKQDFVALDRFFPDDLIVTNPFYQVLDKRGLMERIRGDIIKYSSFEREFDHFRIYGDTAIVVGSETVVPTPDAKRPDAGQKVHRRFTEVWVRREGTWQLVVRHANDVTPR